MHAHICICVSVRVFGFVFLSRFLALNVTSLFGLHPAVTGCVCVSCFQTCVYLLHPKIRLCAQNVILGSHLKQCCFVNMSIRGWKEEAEKQKWTPCRHWRCQHQVSFGKEVAGGGEAL